jgi:hypothetical protein
VYMDPPNIALSYYLIVGDVQLINIDTFCYLWRGRDS